MSWPVAFFFPHDVSIRRLRGRGGMGESFDEPQPSIAEVIDEQKLVRNAAGQEVVSSTRVTVPADMAVTLGSLVTVWPSTPRQREAAVITIANEVNVPPLPSFLVLSLE